MRGAGKRRHGLPAAEGGAGHGSLIVLGGNDVSDVKRGIEVALKELDRTFGDVYGNLQVAPGREFSAWINRHTAGWFDMSSLVSLLFALRGIRKVLMTYSSPSGAQMLWWALSLMRGWRTV